MENPCPPGLAYGPDWITSEIDTGTTATARHRSSIYLPKTMLKENSKAEAG